MIADLDNRFTYHAPTSDQPDRYRALRAMALEFAEMVDQLAPDGREKSLAITKIEEAVMWANAAVAREITPGDVKMKEMAVLANSAIARQG